MNSTFQLLRNVKLGLTHRMTRIVADNENFPSWLFSESATSALSAVHISSFSCPKSSCLKLFGLHFPVIRLPDIRVFAYSSAATRRWIPLGMGAF